MDEILRWRSQEHDIKVRLIAQQILADLTQLSVSKGPAQDVRVERLMLTAHQRITTRHQNHPTTPVPCGHTVKDSTISPHTVHHDRCPANHSGPDLLNSTGLSVFDVDYISFRNYLHVFDQN